MVTSKYAFTRQWPSLYYQLQDLERQEKSLKSGIRSLRSGISIVSCFQERYWVYLRICWKKRCCRTCSGTEAERETILVHFWDQEGFQQNSEGTKAPPRPQQSRAAPTRNSTCSEKDLLFLYIPTLLVPIKVSQHEYSRAARRRI